MSEITDTIPQATDCAANEPFALRVLGDSMEPEFPDGAIIIIDPSGVVENGCYVLAEISEADIEKSQPGKKLPEAGYVFRQLAIVGERYHLKPLNAGYATIEVSDHGTVKGVIVQKSGIRRNATKHYG